MIEININKKNQLGFEMLPDNQQLDLVDVPNIKEGKQWKVQVQVNRDEKWCGNAILYDTEEEAEKAGESLFNRWLATTAYRVVQV